MSMVSQEQVYKQFLEVIADTTDVNFLYTKALEIISQVFRVDRAQILKHAAGSDEVSVLYEHCLKDKSSMLACRFPESIITNEKIINETDTWLVNDLKGSTFEKSNIKSLFILSFVLPETKNGFLLLASSEKEKDYYEHIDLLVDLKLLLEKAALNVHKLSKGYKDISVLMEQNNNLRKQDYLRSNFINSICHELKTPLASIVGFSKMLLTKESNKQSAKEIAEQIQLASNRLSSLISDFLQINNISAGAWMPSIEPCDVGKVIKSSVEEFHVLNKKHTISYKVLDDCPIIETDPKLVRQVLDNLISNSIKYSPNGGSIKISVDALTDKKCLVISVIDQGIGINKNESTKIFNRLYRSNDPVVQSVPGTGLGLSICKEIVSALNGKIEVGSKINEGSKFSLLLPFN